MISYTIVTQYHKFNRIIIVANSLIACTHKYLSNLLTTSVDEGFPIGIVLQSVMIYH